MHGLQMTCRDSWIGGFVRLCSVKDMRTEVVMSAGTFFQLRVNEYFCN